VIAVEHDVKLEAGRETVRPFQFWANGTPQKLRAVSNIAESISSL
jgi:hypothetical protein